MKKIFKPLVLILSILFSSSIETIAHNVDQSYTYLKVFENSVTGRFEITISDINTILGTNYNKNASLEDILSELPEIQYYFLERTGFSSSKGDYEIVFTEPGILEVGGQLGNFLLLNFEFQNMNEVPENLDVYYNVLFDKDESHMGLLLIEYNWKAGIYNNESLPSLFFKGNRTSDTVNLLDGSVFTGFMGMIREGIWHIWIGIDHILFLLALILPAVINRNYNYSFDGNKVAWSVLIPNLVMNPSPEYYTPVEKFKPAFIYIIKIVTFFTISHTITLGLAAFGIIVLPSRLIESIIAISIALAALHNIQPIFRGKEWIIAFIFGFFHGFGFASVLSELRAGEFLGLTLFGFNLGVEIGQVAVIIVLFPILYAIRKTKIYNFLLIFGSFILILISLYWFIERAFNYDMQLGYKLFQAIKNIFV